MRQARLGGTTFIQSLEQPQAAAGQPITELHDKHGARCCRSPLQAAAALMASAGKAAQSTAQHRYGYQYAAPVQQAGRVENVATYSLVRMTVNSLLSVDGWSRSSSKSV